MSGPYADLLATLDAWFERGRTAAGPGIVPCRRGCNACCHGLFDVSAADAELLARAVAALPAGERSALTARAERQLARYAELAPGWGEPYDVDALGEEAFDALADRLAQEPCPALAADGGCAIHERRPATCRMTGLAMGTPDVGVLENVCPIRADFPAYAALAPTSFDLMRFEDEAERHDARARARGAVATTVAAAIRRGARFAADASRPGGS